ncbi:MAG: universal stress protein [Bacillota bacterium]|jgi:nucleotide-binding universal stress UspA family protein
MFGKILLAIEGQEHSEKAIDYAINLAKNCNAEVEVLHVREPLTAYHNRVVYDTVAMNKAIEEDAERIMANAEAKLNEAGIKYTSKIIAGEPADVICDEAEANQMKMIVMGSRAPSVVTRFVLGRVVNTVLTYAPCPVLIVR